MILRRTPPTTGRLEQDLVLDQPASHGLGPPAHEDHQADDADQAVQDVLLERLRDRHDDQRRARQLGAGEALVHVLEDRDHLHHHHGDDADRDHEDRDRVDHGALELALELDRLLDVDGEPPEDGVQDAADLTGGDQVDVQLVEDLRVLAQRVREGGALLDGVLDRAEHLREGLVLGLARQDLEALHQRQAGVDHGRQLAGEDLQVLRLDARADLDVGDVAEIEGLLLDLDRHQAVVPQAVLGRLDRFGLELTLAGLAGAAGGFVDELGHRFTTLAGATAWSMPRRAVPWGKG
jgi:hypothetical protein